LWCPHAADYPFLLAKFLHVCLQVVMGRDYPEATISRLSGLYTTWAGGLLAWPFIDLPFTPFGKAVRAKQELLDWFQVGTCFFSCFFGCEGF
jgi:hypothetical protein